jgi:hypothetical protein
MSTPNKAAASKSTSKPRAGALQVIQGDDQDVIKGQQLTAQYDRAAGAMREIIICGAMMMQLREEHPELAKKGNPKLQLSNVDNCPSKEPLTLQKWLDKYAPKVKRTTALRFLAVTESVCEEYAQIVGAKVAKQFTLQALVTTPADKLPPGAKAKQITLFDFVSGTSQKSWLDRFVAAKSGGGNNRTTPTIIKPKTAKELEAEAEAEMTQIMNSLDAFFLAAHHTRVKPGTRETADAVLEEARKKLKNVKD